MAHVQHKAHVTGWVGWIMAAAFLMLFAGIMHIIFGFAAVFSQGWYIAAGGTVFLLESAQWGWAMVVGGILMILSAVLLYMGNMAGRILGSILVIGSLIANFSVFMATPIWSTIVIVVDFLILYAIIAHGDEMKHLDEMDM